MAQDHLPRVPLPLVGWAPLHPLAINKMLYRHTILKRSLGGSSVRFTSSQVVWDFCEVERQRELREFEDVSRTQAILLENDFIFWHQLANAFCRHLLVWKLLYAQDMFWSCVQMGRKMTEMLKIASLQMLRFSSLQEALRAHCSVQSKVPCGLFHWLNVISVFISQHFFPK